MRNVANSASIPGLALAAASFAPAPAAAAPLSCDALKNRAPPAHTSIVSADIVAAGAFKSPGAGMGGPPADYSRLPAFCRVTGSI